MAYVETALVVYLRALYYPDDPLAIFPLRLLSAADLRLELLREMATLVMILCVAVLAENGRTRIFTAFLYVFGLWDIFYYAWLKVAIGWPVNWLEWDVLFLIPWPWLSPWIAPAAVALLFAVWGTWVLAMNTRFHLTLVSVVLFVSGASLVLAAFLQPGFPLLAKGAEGFRHYQPGVFWWGVFIPGYLLMLAGLIQIIRYGVNGTRSL